MAVKLNELEARIIHREQVPVKWKGGRMVDVWKKKGNAADCNSSRGILISDHMAKSFVDILKQQI